MRTALISIGSNQNDPIRQVMQAFDSLEKHYGPIKKSSLYETKPVNMESDTPFINATASLHTELAAEELLNELLALERAAGRIRKSEEGYQSRPLDLDIILFSDVLIEARVMIPHPRFRERKFVLIPACQIAENMIDPVTGLTIKELLLVCSDTSWVRRLEGELEVL